MSPAPVRVPAQGPDRFPYSWGYGAGVFLILAGFIAGIVMVVTSVNGFVDDVRGFRRAVETGNLQASLERGAEVLVYDESGRFDAGPFDVRVVRTSDDVEVATVPVPDGTSYDVDGRAGTARVEFKVPTSDIYRIEVDSSVGEVIGFAIGGDVGNDRTSGIIRGVVVGSVMVVAGLLALIVTSILHARWRLRGAVLDRVIQAREAVVSTTEPISSPSAREEAAMSAADRATAWAEERLGDVRESIDRQAGSGDPSSWRGSLAAQASDRLDQVEDALAAAEPAVGDVAASADGAERLAARVDEALGRVQDRITSGDSLRDIARDERAAATAVANELTDQARTASADAAERFQAAEGALIDQAGQPFERLRSDVDALTTAGLEDLTAAAERAATEARTVGTSALQDLGTVGTGAVEDVSAIGTGAIEDLTAAGSAAVEGIAGVEGAEELAAGLAAAGTAAVVGGAVARTAEPDPRVLPPSSLPAPPQLQSSLPAPPPPAAVSTPAAPPPPRAAAIPEPPDSELPAPPRPAPVEVETPEPDGAAPVAAGVAAEPSPPAALPGEGAAVVGASAPSGRPTIAPPPTAAAMVRKPLAVPAPLAAPTTGRPAPEATAPMSETTAGDAGAVSAAVPAADLAQRGGAGSFSALAPPPSRSFLAPPPPASAPPPVAARPMPTSVAEGDALEADPAEAAVEVEPETGRPARSEFSLAPPPDHSGLPG